jgi:hypothetical protein
MNIWLKILLKLVKSKYPYLKGNVFLFIFV